ncbi:MAG: GIY-YIG nuclease family protein [bacterium]|nr:GIY-YIG nuclease family protein [bacterium]
MYFVYVLRSLKDGRCYTGCTRDVSERLKRHNAGRVKSTKYRKPLEIVHVEEYRTLSEARIKESLLKKKSKLNLL